eukprot:787235-Prorocentrum_minimum.AAC.3
MLESRSHLVRGLDDVIVTLVHRATSREPIHGSRTSGSTSRSTTDCLGFVAVKAFTCLPYVARTCNKKLTVYYAVNTI